MILQYQYSLNQCVIRIRFDNIKYLPLPLFCSNNNYSESSVSKSISKDTVMGKIVETFHVFLFFFQA